MIIIESLEAMQALLGREYAISDWIEISPEMVRAFGETTLDRQWIHLDEERAARETPFGGAIAHGMLTLSLTTAFMQNAMKIEGVSMVINAGFNRVRFVTPVRVGAKLRARLKLTGFEWLGESSSPPPSDIRKRRHAELITEMTIECEGSDTPVCIAETVVRRFPASPPDRLNVA